MTNEAGEQADRDRLIESIGSHTTAMENASLPALLNPILDTDLTIQQLKVMIVLVTSHNGATGRTLADSFGVTMASMSGLLDRLVAHGVAVRSGDPADHRVRRIMATELGVAVVRKLVAVRPAFRSHVLAEVAIDDLRALERGMQAVSAELTKSQRTPNAFQPPTQ